VIRSAGQGIGWFAALALAPVLLFAYRDLWAVVLLFGLAGVLVRHRARRLVSLPPWSLPLLALYGWAVVAAAFAVYPVTDKLYDPGILIVFCLVIASFAPLPSRFLAIGLLVALPLLAFDALSGNLIRELMPPPHDPERDAIATSRGIGLALLLLPAAALSWYQSGGWLLGRVLIVTGGVATAFSTIDLYGLVLLSALGAALLAGWAPRWGARLMVGLGGAVLTLPFVLAVALPPVARILTFEALPDSWIHRLIIWRTVLDAWLSDRILIGAGAGASEALGERLGMISLKSGEPVSLVSVHPHNIPVEILYETGLAGYGLLLAAFVLAGRRLMRAEWPPRLMAAAAALATGSLVVMAGEGSIWNAQLPATIVLGVYMLRATHYEEPR
jgi:O-antigen ligase